jgi:hypothetical protein
MEQRIEVDSNKTSVSGFLANNFDDDDFIMNDNTSNVTGEFQEYAVQETVRPSTRSSTDPETQDALHMVFDADNSDEDVGPGNPDDNSDDSSDVGAIMDKEEKLLYSDWSVYEFDYSSTRMSFEDVRSHLKQEASGRFTPLHQIRIVTNCKTLLRHFPTSSFGNI